MRRIVSLVCRALPLLILLVSLSWPTTIQAKETTADVATLFRVFYDTNGGVEIFGLPLSGNFDRDGLQAQYFERARLEWHPELSGTENEVLVSALGRTLTNDRSFPKAVPQADRIYFHQTAHNMGGSFGSFWFAHNGQRLFGYPLSEELQERSADDGQMYTVQYFERARMEWHPERGQVLLGRLGTQQYSANLLGVQSVEPTLSSYEQGVLGILLDARGTAGVASPQLDPALIKIARECSADMAARGYFSHQTPEGTNIFTLLNAAGIGWGYAGEIISRNNYSAAQTAEIAGNAYLASPLHRAVALDPQYTAVGVGHSVDRNGMHYYTVVFVRR